MSKKISFLVFNFGKKRLRNLWHTMEVVRQIQQDNMYANIEFVCIEHGDEEYSKEKAEECGFRYEYYFDPLLLSHRSTLRNKAVEHAEHDWVILHDNDILPDPKFFDDIMDMIETTDVDYFSNFKEVYDLTEQLTGILVADLQTQNKFIFGYINGTDRTHTHNFDACAIRPHGFWTFTEATGGSFTIKKDTFLANPFDEEYQQWGAEDNAFKLHQVAAIGWEKFGMLNKVLLHSYHDTPVNYDPSTGIIQIHTEDLNKNRDMLYSSIDSLSGGMNTDSFELVETTLCVTATNR
jgi:hypothetical protein